MTHLVLEPMHVHWMNNCARDEKNVSVVHRARRVRCYCLHALPAAGVLPMGRRLGCVPCGKVAAK